MKFAPDRPYHHRCSFVRAPEQALSDCIERRAGNRSDDTDQSVLSENQTIEMHYAIKPNNAQWRWFRSGQRNPR